MTSRRSAHARDICCTELRQEASEIIEQSPARRTIKATQRSTTGDRAVQHAMHRELALDVDRNGQRQADLRTEPLEQRRLGGQRGLGGGVTGEPGRRIRRRAPPPPAAARRSRDAQHEPPGPRPFGPPEPRDRRATERVDGHNRVREQRFVGHAPSMTDESPRHDDTQRRRLNDNRPEIGAVFAHVDRRPPRTTVDESGLWRTEEAVVVLVEC